jgi:hypothetical protein
MLKKQGRKIKTYYEGERLKIQVDNAAIFEGVITLLKDDSVFISNRGFAVSSITKVFIPRKPAKPFPINKEQALYIAGGVALSTFGMQAAGWAPTGRAFIYSSAIGFGPILIMVASRKIHLKRKRYSIGRKFKLQELDFYSFLKKEKD